MPRFTNLEFLFANAKYHWSHWTWNPETCNKKCHKYCLRQKKQSCLKRKQKAALSRLKILKQSYWAQALRRVPLFSCHRASPAHRGHSFNAGRVLKAPPVLDAAWWHWGAPSACSQSEKGRREKAYFICSNAAVRWCYVVQSPGNVYVTLFEPWGKKLSANYFPGNWPCNVIPYMRIAGKTLDIIRFKKDKRALCDGNLMRWASN